MFDFFSEARFKHSKSFHDRPFLLFMGPQRSGTTWIDRYLRAHGAICMPSAVKEIFFFNQHFEKGFDFYKSHFKPSAQHKILSEVSTTAFHEPEAPSRVKDILGDGVRLVCPLRHPVERSYSLYQHHLRHGRVTGSLQEACEQKPQILESSRYAKHVENWLQHFSRDQMSFLFQETLSENPEQFARSLCEASGIPFKDIPVKLKAKINAQTKSRNRFVALMAQRGADLLRSNRLYFVVNFAKAIGLKAVVFGKENTADLEVDMPQEDREWLDEQLAGEVEKLEQLIGPVPQWHNNK